MNVCGLEYLPLNCPRYFNLSLDRCREIEEGQLPKLRWMVVLPTLQLIQIAVLCFEECQIFAPNFIKIT